MKKCTKCKKFKPITDYYRSKETNDGRKNQCKDCQNFIKKEKIKAMIVVKNLKLEETTKNAKNIWGGIGPWSRKYSDCVECGLTVYKHKGNGVCSRCYVKLRQSPSDQKDVAAKRMRDYYKKNKKKVRKSKDKYDSLVKIVVRDCKNDLDNQKPEIKNLLKFINKRSTL